MTKVTVNVKTKVLEAIIVIEVVTADRTSRKLADLMKLTGGKIYICDQCRSVHLLDEPMKEVYIQQTGEMKRLCEKCCEDMGIIDVEILLHDLKKHNAKYLALG